MQHEALAMDEHTNPLGVSINDWISNFDGFNQTFGAGISKVTTDGQVPEIVGAFIHLQHTTEARQSISIHTPFSTFVQQRVLCGRLT